MSVAKPQVLDARQIPDHFGVWYDNFRKGGIIRFALPETEIFQKVVQGGVLQPPYILCEVLAEVRPHDRPHRPGLRISLVQGNGYFFDGADASTQKEHTLRIPFEYVDDVIRALTACRNEVHRVRGADEH